MFRAELIRWLQGPPFKGWQGIACAIIAIGLPTAVRASLEGAVTGCEFTPYVPFIFICAILTPWWAAAVAALASVAIMGGLLGGSPAHGLSCFVPSVGMFLASSTVMIGAAILIRSVIVAIQKRGADESLGGIVFSLEKGEVWASWYGQGPPVLLGSQRKVSEMMRDFIAQEELARRLTAK